MYEFGIVGLGPAGCLFLACLPDERLARTVVFDSGCVGGDLARLYGRVVANLTCAQLSAALRAVPRWAEAPLEVFDNYGPDVCPPLADLCVQLRELMKPVLSRVTLHSQHVTEIRQKVGHWVLHTVAGIPEGVAAVKVVVCTGGDPRRMNYPRPCIPLEVALDKVALASYIRPGDRVVVFGTAHSGTLVLRNVREAGGIGVGVYRCGPAFRWARPHTPECPCIALGGTGCHDSEGVKQESAAIADAIVRREWGAETPVLICTEDTEALVRAVIEATYVVYAVGFVSRMPRIVRFDGGCVEGYDPVTAAIAPGIWGFGLAYPSLYEKPQGGKAPDV
jgi:hypothetical protein